jgi:hypothetical protein
VWIVFLIHAWYAIRSGYYISHVTGVWLALASDWRDGVFYRPLVGEHGYGGTRYFPLYFVLTGLLMRAGVTAISAAVVVMVASLGALVGGLLLVLRRIDLGWWPVLLLATGAVAPYFVQETVWELRGDVLATALNVWGLAFAADLLRRESHRASLWLSAVCFTLAFATKMTTVFGLAAAFLALHLAGRRAAARQVGAYTLAGMGCVAAGIWVASGGRAYESLRACALGGTSLGEMLQTMIVAGPLALTSGFWILKVIFLPVAILLLLEIRRGWSELPTLFLISSALVTWFIMSSPGTALPNHVLDLYVASLIFVGYVLHRRPRLATVGLILVCAFMLIATRQIAQNMRRFDLRTASLTLPLEREALLNEVSWFRGQVLSEAPWLPVTAGARPYVLDPFALRVIGQNDSARLDGLIANIAQRRFDQILLLEDPETPRGAGWYAEVHFGRRVLEHIRRHYRYKTTIAGMRVYVPADEEEPAKPPVVFYCGGGGTGWPGFAYFDRSGSCGGPTTDPG